jgi:hypothetical protein
MTKTIKFLTMMLIVAITMFSLSGCSKDDDDDSIISIHKNDILCATIGANLTQEYVISEDPSNCTILFFYMYDYHGGISLNFFWQNSLTGEKNYRMNDVEKLDDEHYKLSDEGEVIVVGHGHYGYYYAYYNRDQNILYFSANRPRGSDGENETGLVNTKWKAETQLVMYLYFVNESQAKIGTDINFVEGSYQNCTYYYANGEGTIIGDYIATFSVREKNLMFFLDGIAIPFTKI